MPRGGYSTITSIKFCWIPYSRGQISEVALITQCSKMKQNGEFIRRLERNIMELLGRNSSQEFQEGLQKRTHEGCRFPFFSVLVHVCSLFFLLLSPSPPLPPPLSPLLPSPLLSLLFPPSPPPASLQPSPFLLIFLCHLKRIRGSFHFS